MYQFILLYIYINKYIYMGNKHRVMDQRLDSLVWKIEMIKKQSLYFIYNIKRLKFNIQTFYDEFEYELKS